VQALASCGKSQRAAAAGGRRQAAGGGRQRQPSREGPPTTAIADGNNGAHSQRWQFPDIHYQSKGILGRNMEKDKEADLGGNKEKQQKKLGS
jgi:hypothetical protein